MFEFEDTYDSVDSIPEEYRGLYGESDNGFTLNDGARGIVSAYRGTAEALATERSKLKNVNAESAGRRADLKRFDELATSLGLELGEDGAAAAISAHIDELSGQVKNGSEIKVNMEKIKADAERRIQEATAASDDKLARMQNSLSTYLVDREAQAAIVAERGASELLLPLVKQFCKVVEDEGSYAVRIVDDNGDVRSDGKGGFMGVAQFVSEMKTNKSYARAFESEAPAGTGSNPGNSRKPVNTNTASENKSAVDKIRAGLANR